MTGNTFGQKYSNDLYIGSLKKKLSVHVRIVSTLRRRTDVHLFLFLNVLTYLYLFSNQIV